VRLLRSERSTTSTLETATSAGSKREWRDASRLGCRRATHPGCAGHPEHRGGSQRAAGRMPRSKAIRRCELGSSARRACKSAWPTMSPLGHSLTFQRACGMSALPSEAEIGAVFRHAATGHELTSPQIRLSQSKSIGQAAAATSSRFSISRTGRCADQRAACLLGFHSSLSCFPSATCSLVISQIIAKKTSLASHRRRAYQG
jgi:hypothetical protein